MESIRCVNEMQIISVSVNRNGISVFVSRVVKILRLFSDVANVSVRMKPHQMLVPLVAVYLDPVII